MKLVFHLGDFRTGSTAIQSVLCRFGAEQGLFYPPGFNHAALAQSLSDPGVRDAAFSALAGQLAETDLPQAVISAEHFEFTDPADLARALDTHLPDHEARLIAYVRPHGPAFLARYAESVKIGNFDGRPGDYLNQPQTRWRLSYAARFGRWRNTFGDRFDLRLYDRAAFPGASVLRDFLKAVTGRDPGDLPTADPNPNPSPGLKGLAMARALHRAIGPLPDDATHAAARWTIGRHLGRLIAAEGRPDTPLALNRPLAGRIVARFAADAMATDTAFFGPATPLSDALAGLEEGAPVRAQSHEPADHLGPDARAALALWGKMLRHGLTAPGGAALLNGLYHE